VLASKVPAEADREWSTRLLLRDQNFTPPQHDRLNHATNLSAKDHRVWSVSIECMCAILRCTKDWTMRPPWPLGLLACGALRSNVFGHGFWTFSCQSHQERLAFWCGLQCKRALGEKCNRASPTGFVPRQRDLVLVVITAPIISVHMHLALGDRQGSFWPCFDYVLFMFWMLYIYICIYLYTFTPLGSH